MSELRRGAQLLQLARLQLLVGARSQRLRIASRWVWNVRSSLVSSNTLDDDEARGERAPFACRRGAWPWHSRSAAWLRSRIVGAAHLRQRQFLRCAYCSICCSTSVWRASVESWRSALDRTASSWPFDDLGAVLDQHLLDPAALDRVEIDGERAARPGRAAAGNPRTARACTSEIWIRDLRHRLGPDTRREQPEDQQQQQQWPRPPPAIRYARSKRLTSTTCPSPRR